MKYYSHRGLYNPQQNILENSKEAFQCAVDENVGIELDVRLTRDKEVIVVHDASLKRIYGLDKSVEALSYNELNDLTKDTLRIMKFEEFLEFINGRVSLIVECKHCFDNTALCLKVTHLLDNYKGEFCVESFHPLIVRWFKKNRPHFKRGQLVMTKDRYDNGFLWFFGGSGITHWLTKPDFYAFHYRVGSRKLSHWYYRYLSRHCDIVLWTMKKDSPHYFDADAIIYETF